jgi:NAD(P)-dependent dehydrogenase (short-subunit alcohol dehydrogenase family)
MSKTTEKVILITGASSGIGRACAQHLAQKGYRVFGTSRRAPFPPDVAEAGQVTMFQMDVNEDDSVRRGVDFILQEAGHLDVAVNNAGIHIAGAVEDTSVEEAKKQFETNFFGALRVCRAVLPSMRERQSGYIVNVSSIGGLVGLPYQGFYSATKFAVEGMTEALRMEVRPFGIKVLLIEPGDIRTEHVWHRTAASQDHSVYRDYLDRVMDTVDIQESNGASPLKVAQTLERAINHPSPRLRYRVGAFDQRLAGALKGVVPDRLFEWILMKNYKLI